MADIGHVTDASFESDVLNSDLPVLVDYWAEWCGPCKVIAPVLEEIATEYDGKMKVCKARHRRQWRNTPQVWDPRHSYTDAV